MPTHMATTLSSMVWGSGFSSHRDTGGNFPRGVPVFTGYHPVPHDTFSGAEVKEKMNDGIRARKAAARGTKPSDDYKEAYIEISKSQHVCRYVHRYALIVTRFSSRLLKGPEPWSHHQHETVMLCSVLPHRLTT